jgi:hypothetical protein
VPNPIISIIVFSFLAALVGNDIAQRRWPHNATVIAAVFVMGVNLTVQALEISDQVIAYQIANFGG